MKLSKLMAATAVAFLLVVVLAIPAEARVHRHHQSRSHHRVVHAAHVVMQECVPNNNGRCLWSGAIARTSHVRRGGQRVTGFDRHAHSAGTITIDTALGPVTVSPSLSGPIVGFIADVKARGFEGPVHCLSFSRSHVAGSLHFSGNACDFAQCGWGCTKPVMHHVADLAAKYGLRDGCEFRDYGHIDNGHHLDRARILRNCGAAYADAVAPVGIKVAYRHHRPSLYESVADFKDGIAQ